MEPYIGQIQAFGFNFAPRGWAQCNGQLLPIAQNQALFSLLGTYYGGDGRTTFALPDLRGRSIVGAGNGKGLSPVNVGASGGAESISLSTANIPAHTHAVSVSVNTGNGEESGAQNAFISNHAGAFSEEGTAGAVLGGVAVGNTGGGQAVNSRNPYLGINYCIALQGIFPPRS